MNKPKPNFQNLKNALYQNLFEKEEWRFVFNYIGEDSTILTREVCIYLNPEKNKIIFTMMDMEYLFGNIDFDSISSQYFRFSYCTYKQIICLEECSYNNEPTKPPYFLLKLPKGFRIDSAEAESIHESLAKTFQIFWHLRYLPQMQPFF